MSEENKSYYKHKDCHIYKKNIVLMMTMKNAIKLETTVNTLENIT